MGIQHEARAYDSFSKLLKQLEDCRGLFDEAGLAYPEPLHRMLGHLNAPNGNGASGARPSLHIPPPHAPNRPAGVADGWLWVPISTLTAQVCVLGILRGAGGPLPVRQIKAELTARGINYNDGSVANIGTRLEQQGIIRRDDNGWSLMDQTKAPLLNGKYAWGAEEAFSMYELATRRRESILHILGYFNGGLQTAQILTQLQECSWFKAAVNKDLLKLDMEELRKAGKVRRGAQKKWTVATEAR